METICEMCRDASGYKNTHCIHRQEENYCYGHNETRPCKICKIIEAERQQERRELFQKVALKLLPEADIKSDYKDIMQKAKGFTEKLLQASQKFAEQQPRKLELTK